MSIEEHVIFKKLSEKLELNPNALYHRIYRLSTNKNVAMNVAMFYIAKQNNIKINRYLDDSMRSALQAIDNVGKSSNISSPQTKPPTKQTTYKLGSLNLHPLPPLITERNIKELEKNIEAYQRIYLFENSIREFINLVLSKKFGKNWWNNEHFADDFKIKVDGYKKSEENNPWAKRGQAHELYYLNLEDLATIIEKAKRIFKPYFDYMGKSINENWLRVRIHDVNKVRRIVSHSNPITPKLSRDCEVDVDKWLEQIPRIIKNI